jgi:glyoxylase-like metal-dependent hydrolase (beta-lactamase superfamily II)
VAVNRIQDTAGDLSWDTPGVFEVAAGVFRVPLPLPGDGLRAVNVYVVAGDDGVLLVDGGWAIDVGREALLAGLHLLGRSLRDIRRFVVTHAHRDHYTLAIVVRREYGTSVALGVGERPALEAILDGPEAALADRVRHLRSLGASDLARRLDDLQRDQPPETHDYEPPDGWLADGETVTHGDRRLEVVSTPGHTRGHVVFHDLKARLLFAGDHVLPTITPSIGFEPVLSPDPLGDYMRSLAIVRARPDAILLPAHGPVAHSVHARVDELTAHHGARLDASEKAVHAGATTAYEVAAELTWTRRERALADLDDFNQMLAVTETAAHLDLLVAQGRSRRDQVDGVLRYTPM